MTKTKSVDLSQGEAADGLWEELWTREQLALAVGRPVKSLERFRRRDGAALDLPGGVVIPLVRFGRKVFVARAAAVAALQAHLASQVGLAQLGSARPTDPAQGKRRGPGRPRKALG